MPDALDIWQSSREVGGPGSTGLTAAPYQPLALEYVEKEHIPRTLEHTDWNKSQGAIILGIERSTPDRKIRLYKLKR